MLRIVVCIWGLMWLFLGCTQFQSRQEIVYEDGKLQKFSYLNDSQGSRKGQGDAGAFMDAVEVLQKADPAAIPQLPDLPRFQKNTRPPVCIYTGVIKNSTKYDVTVPSMNSSATLQIPAHGWIEYRAYHKSFDLTVYSDGKPFYCLKVCANPKDYQFMCSKYDFIAEIVKPEPKPKADRKMKRYKRKPKGDEGVEGTG